MRNTSNTLYAAAALLFVFASVAVHAADNSGRIWITKPLPANPDWVESWVNDINDLGWIAGTLPGWTGFVALPEPATLALVAFAATAAGFNVLIYTKADKLSANKQHKHATNLDAALNIKADRRIVFSAKTGQGCEELKSILASYLER